jgi:hypothetical protein
LAHIVVGKTQTYVPPRPIRVKLNGFAIVCHCRFVIIRIAVFITNGDVSFGIFRLEFYGFPVTNDFGLFICRVAVIDLSVTVVGITQKIISTLGI